MGLQCSRPCSQSHAQPKQLGGGLKQAWRTRDSCHNMQTMTAQSAKKHCHAPIRCWPRSCCKSVRTTAECTSRPLKPSQPSRPYPRSIESTPADVSLCNCSTQLSCEQSSALSVMRSASNMMHKVFKHVLNGGRPEEAMCTQLTPMHNSSIETQPRPVARLPLVCQSVTHQMKGHKHHLLKCRMLPESVCPRLQVVMLLPLVSL